jgi:hypothetical protein
MTAISSRHQAEWVAAGLRRAAAEVGVEIPLAYAHHIAVAGLVNSSQLGVTRLGAGVVIHTQPSTGRELPIVVGYADARGQWNRDGRRYLPGPVADTPNDDVSARKESPDDAA